jgi:3-oxoacyl-ACP reductase-like protein
MSIFGKIKDAIFGKKAVAAEAAPAATPAAAPAAAPAAPQAISEVDVEVVLNGLAAQSDQKLNWQSSIVDLMKLLGMDASLSERKELAQELGYTGALDGSAEMNIWLHKQVLRQLAANGGKVPANLLD